MSDQSDSAAEGFPAFAGLTHRELLVLASTGNADAQSAMADRMAALELPDEQRLISAEWWARIAATHGRERDVKRLVGLLCFLAGRQLGMGLRANGIENAAEAVALCDDLADQGCEESAVLLSQLQPVLQQDGISHETYALAKAMRQRGDV